MTLPIPVPVTAFYAALSALWLVFLAVRVIRLRFKYRVGLNSGGNPELEAAQRTHANAAEYLPTGLVLLLVLELMAPPLWALHAIGVALIAGRVAHFLGLRHSRGASLERATGMVLTFAAYLGAALTLILAVVLR